VKAIEVDTYQTALEVTDNATPRSAQEARFSLQYVLAHAWQHGSVRLAAFSDASLADEATRALMARVHLRAAAELTAGFPSMRAARVRIVLDDGRVLQHFSPHRRGDPEAPLTDAELEEKFDELASPVIGREAAARLRAQVWRLETSELAELQLVRGSL
jgi:2-methylcitrate dehydratase PrpD